LHKSEKTDSILEIIGENTVTIKARLTPKLLRLMYNGFPLYHNRNFGWGYLVPKLGVDIKEIENEKIKFPYEYIKTTL
jgi:DNA polymerase gamma 1